MAEESPFSTVFSGGAVLFVGLLFQYGVEFGSKLVVARLLGRVDYGAVSLGVKLLSTLTVVVLLGTHNGVGRFLPRFDDRARRRGVLVAAFGIVLPVAVVASAAVVLSADLVATRAFDDPAVGPVVRVFGLALPLAAVVRLTVATVRGRQEALPRVVLQNVAQPVSRFALIAAAVALGIGAVGVAGAYLVSYAFVAGLAAWYLLRRTALLAAVGHEPMGRELFSFSAPLLVVATTTTVFVNADTFLLGVFSTTAAVGLYSAVYPLAVVLTLVLEAINFVAMPVISELHADDRTHEMARTYQVAAKWVLAATLPPFLVVVSFPGVVIGATFGPAYTDGALALSILAVGFFSHAVAGPAGNALTAIGRPRVLMYDNVAVAAVNIALNVVFIPRNGVVGAAAATTVGYLLMNGLYLTQLHRETGLHPFRVTALRPVVVAAVGWTALYGLARAVGVSPGVVVAVSVAFVAVYAVAVLRYGGVDPEERRLVRAFEKRSGVQFDRVRRLARVLRS